jgi:hypothetical protein
MFGATMRRCAASLPLVLLCLVLASLSAGGCASVRPMSMPNRGGHPREMPGSAAEPRMTTKELQTYVKVVAGKEPPTTLIAGDGSRCTVTERRYRNIQVGDDALCAWHKGERAP